MSPRFDGLYILLTFGILLTKCMLSYYYVYVVSMLSFADEDMSGSHKCRYSMTR